MHGPSRRKARVQRRRCWPVSSPLPEDQRRSPSATLSNEPGRWRPHDKSTMLSAEATMGTRNFKCPKDVESERQLQTVPRRARDRFLKVHQSNQIQSPASGIGRNRKGGGPSCHVLRRLQCLQRLAQQPSPRGSHKGLIQATCNHPDRWVHSRDRHPLILGHRYPRRGK